MSAMQKSRIVLLLSTALIATSVVLFMDSCKKKDNTSSTTTEDTGYASDHSTSEKTFNDVESISDMAANVSSGGSLGYKTAETTIGACATVTKTTGATNVITIDFGSVNCLCNDGSYRRGKIIVTYTGNYADSASTHAITFDNYYQNDNQVTGTKTVTNMGHNSAGQTYFNVHVAGSVILANGSGTLSATWDRVRTWISTGTVNVYQISGSGTLTRANGTTVAVAITSPLVIASNCRWIEAGTVTYTLPSGLTRVMNYGNTAVCDAEAQLTLPNGKVYNIALK